MVKERASSKGNEASDGAGAAQAPETAEAAEDAMAQDEIGKTPDAPEEPGSGKPVASGEDDISNAFASSSDEGFADIPVPAKGEVDVDVAGVPGDVPPISPDFDGVPAASSSFGNLDLNEREAMAAFLGSDDDYASLPNPETFNAYPPEVQRKIMEWTDRDVKARRDDESRRQDELMRARVDHARRRQMIPAVVIVLAVLCGAVTGIITGNPLFPLVFLIIPVVVAVALIVADDDPQGPDGRRNPFLRNIRR